MKFIQFSFYVSFIFRLWVHSISTQTTILISNAILNSEYLSDKQTREMVKSLLSKFTLHRSNEKSQKKKS